MTDPGPAAEKHDPLAHAMAGESSAYAPGCLACGPPPTPYDLGCFWHGEEPIPDGAYLVCGECWHCFDTPADLLTAVATMCTELGMTMTTVDADAVTFCPLCSHDF